jgi:chemotaxis signal transduction protein
VAKYVALTVRKLKPDSYDDWRKAWEGDRSDFPKGARAYVCRNLKDPDEIVAFGIVEMDDISEMGSDEMRQAQEERTQAMAPYVESVGTDAVYEVIDEISS